VATAAAVTLLSQTEWEYSFRLSPWSQEFDLQ